MVDSGADRTDGTSVRQKAKAAAGGFFQKTLFWISQAVVLGDEICLDEQGMSEGVRVLSGPSRTTVSSGTVWRAI